MLAPISLDKFIKYDPEEVTPALLLSPFGQPLSRSEHYSLAKSLYPCSYIDGKTGHEWHLANAVKAVASGKKPVITDKMLYWGSAALTVGTMGALLNTVATGQTPQSWTDVFYPRNGQKNDDDTDQRLVMPTIVKDVPHLISHPLKTISGKLRGEFSTFWNLYHNQDYQGRQIVNPEDSTPSQALDATAYVFDQMFMPFSVRNTKQALDKGQGVSSVASNLIGLNAAPSSVSRTPAQNLLHQLTKDKMPSGAISQEKGQQIDERGKIRRNAKDDTTALEDAVKNNNISPKQATQMLEDRGVPGDIQKLKKLSLDDAMKVYKQANDQEKDAWKSTMLDKVKSLDNVTPEERNKALDKMKALGLNPQTDEPRYYHNLDVSKEHFKADIALQNLPEFKKLTSDQQEKAKKILSETFSEAKLEKAKPEDKTDDHKYDLEDAKVILEGLKNDVHPKTKIPNYLYEVIDDALDEKKKQVDIPVPG